MLSHSVRNEQITYYNENNTLNTFLSNEDEKESKEIANRVLDETFKELKSSINAIATFSMCVNSMIQKSFLLPPAPPPFSLKQIKKVWELYLLYLVIRLSHCL